MDEALCRNTVELCGALAAAPRFSHLSRGERFFIFPVETRRLSGAVDTINVVAREALLAALRIEEAERLCVQGELRSFNNRREEGPKLVITVFARALSLVKRFCPLTIASRSGSPLRKSSVINGFDLWAPR